MLALEYRNIYKRKNHKTNIIYNRTWICSAYRIWMVNVLNKERRTNKNIIPSTLVELESKEIKYSEVRDED